MATSGTQWTGHEQEALLKRPVAAQWKVDIANTYNMGYFVLGASMKLSREFGRTVTREAVVTEILHLRDRFANFVWFYGLSSVSYNQWNNKVTVMNEYLAEGGQDSRRLMDYRVHGETMYRDL
ncbi:hypothetical protein C2S51_027777 [Perilla frutescens var. frutescens]|nr:hypothetical protein C2S51_027777 [Perilla frutescens var. frutescens]